MQIRRLRVPAWIGLVGLLAALTCATDVRASGDGTDDDPDPYYVPPEARTKVYWTGPDHGLWKTETNWSTQQVPLDGEDVFVTQSGPAVQTAIYQLRSSVEKTFSSVTVEGTGGGAMILSQSGSRSDGITDIFSVDEVVGRTGVGIYNQTGGVNLLNAGQGFNHQAAGDLILGQERTGNGTYNLSGTTAFLRERSGDDAHLVVGDAGSGVFNQTGGVTLAAQLILGRQATGNGTLFLNNRTGTAYTDRLIPTAGEQFAEIFSDNALPKTGTLYSFSTVVGDAGTGRVVQDGGIHRVDNLYLAGGLEANGATLDAGSVGTYELSGDGSLVVTGRSVVGNFGRGSFAQTGGTQTIGNFLDLGLNAGASGTYTLSGGTVGVTGGMKVGADGTGRVDQTGGAISVGGTTYIGQAGAGSWVQSSGSNRATWLYLAGDFDELGNPINATSAATYNLSGNATLQVIKTAAIGISGDATFTQTGGTMSSTGMIVGYAGHGNFIQQNGVNTIARELVHGRPTGPAGELIIGKIAGGTGEYQMHGGTLKADDVTVGYDGQGSFLQDGGSVQVVDSVFVASTSGSSSYTISNGELRTLAVEVGFAGFAEGRVNYGGAGQFNQTGGTVTTQGLEIGQPGYSGVAGIPAYRLSGGTLNVDFAYVGGVFNHDLGLPGIFEQSGGIVQGYGNHNQIFVDGPGSRYDLSGGEIHLRNFVSFVDSQINQTGGTVYGGEVGAAGGTYNLSGVDSRIITSSLPVGARMSTGTDDILPGAFNQSGGSVTVTDTNGYGDVVNVVAGGTYNLSGTGQLTVNGGEHIGGRYVFSYDPIDPDSYIPAPRTSQFHQTGGTHQVNGTLTIADNQSLFIGQPGSVGIYDLADGNLNADAIDNHGNFNFSGGTLQVGQFDNSGTLALSGPGTRTIDGRVTNSGTVQVKNTVVSYTGTFTNNGAYLSDPSTNNFTDLIVGSTGYLSAGTGDQFVVTGNFMNGSGQNLVWKTTEAGLEITGAGEHTFALAGIDDGADLNGYTNNFAWGSFTLGDGAMLDLSDGNTASGAALYARLFFLEDGLAQLRDIHSDFNIYYNARLSGNHWLDGLAYDLNGAGRLVPAWNYDGGGTRQVPDGVSSLGALLFSLGAIVLGGTWKRR